MKTVVFYLVKFTEDYERYSMLKETEKEFEEWVFKNVGKVIQKEEVPLDECSQEIQAQSREWESDLTDTEEIILKSGNHSITR